MDKQQIIKNFFKKQEVRNYTYAALFLLISSFFAFFAVKPSLLIAFSLRKEAFELKQVNQIYEKDIVKAIDVQSKLENMRNKLHLLDESLPQTPETKTLIDDIKQAASQEGIIIRNLTLSAVDLKNESKNTLLKLLSVDMETNTDFSVTSRFIKKMMDQRRIKTIKKFKVSRNENVATESANLRINLEIEGYYL